MNIVQFRYLSHFSRFWYFHEFETAKFRFNFLFYKSKLLKANQYIYLLRKANRAVRWLDCSAPPISSNQRIHHQTERWWHFSNVHVFSSFWQNVMKYYLTYLKSKRYKNEKKIDDTVNRVPHLSKRLLLPI